MKVPDRVYNSCAVSCASLPLLRPLRSRPHSRPRSHPRPRSHLCYCSRFRPRSRPRSHLVFVHGVFQRLEEAGIRRFRPRVGH